MSAKRQRATKHNVAWQGAKPDAVRILVAATAQKPHLDLDQMEERPWSFIRLFLGTKETTQIFYHDHRLISRSEKKYNVPKAYLPPCAPGYRNAQGFYYFIVSVNQWAHDSWPSLEGFKLHSPDETEEDGLKVHVHRLELGDVEGRAYCMPGSNIVVYCFKDDDNAVCPHGPGSSEPCSLTNARPIEVYDDDISWIGSPCELAVAVATANARSDTPGN